MLVNRSVLALYVMLDTYT